jgi:hypothetical protein
MLYPWLKGYRLPQKGWRLLGLRTYYSHDAEFVSVRKSRSFKNEPNRYAGRPGMPAGLENSMAPLDTTRGKNHRSLSGSGFEPF